MKNWYIVQSHSSFENKVAGLIKEEAEKAKISDKFEEIVVPTHDVTEVKRGKRIQRKKKYFPGYVLIKSEMDNNIYHMIKNIKRVSGFLGTKGIPVPVSDKEIEKILGQIKDGVAQPKSGIEYSVGEKVQVVDGPFASFSGLVEEIDEEKKQKVHQQPELFHQRCTLYQILVGLHHLLFDLKSFQFPCQKLEQECLLFLKNH